MCSCHSIPECCIMFSGVKLSMGSFVLLAWIDWPPLLPVGSRLLSWFDVT